MLLRAEACFGVTPTRGPTRSVFTVSHRPDGFRHPRGSQACCILQPILGFTEFKVCPVRARTGFDLPPDATPSRAFPSLAAVPVVAGQSFPPAVGESCDPPRLRGIVPQRSPLLGFALPLFRRSVLSWASLLKQLDSASRKAMNSRHGVRARSVAPHGFAMPRHRPLRPPGPAESVWQRSPRGGAPVGLLGLPPCPRSSRHHSG